MLNVRLKVGHLEQCTKDIMMEFFRNNQNGPIFQ